MADLHDQWCESDQVYPGLTTPCRCDERDALRVLFKAVGWDHCVVVPRSFVESVLYMGSFEGDMLDRLYSEAEALLCHGHTHNAQTDSAPEHRQFGSFDRSDER